MFGAGASHGARCPRPPLGAELHVYVRRYLDCLIEDRRAPLQIPGTEYPVPQKLEEELLKMLGDARSFEQLVVDLLKQGENDLLGSLNLLMAHALTPRDADDILKFDEAFVDKPDLYDDFLGSRFRHSDFENVSFITLNYDCLLERAICRAICRTYFSSDPLRDGNQCLCNHVNCHLNEIGNGVEVLKPHGSINWVPDFNMRRLAPGEATPVGATGCSSGVHFHMIKALPSPPVSPVSLILMAHYAPEKKSRFNPRTLGRIREIAHERISAANEIEIIGVHLPDIPDDDPFLDDVLKIMREKIRDRGCVVRYVNPGRADAERAKGYGFEVIEADFERYVKNGKS